MKTSMIFYIGSAILMAFAPLFLPMSIVAVAMLLLFLSYTISAFIANVKGFQFTGYGLVSVAISGLRLGGMEWQIMLLVVLLFGVLVLCFGNKTKLDMPLRPL